MNEILEQRPLFNKLIIESISDGLFCIDKDMRCTFINSPALKMLGYACEDCIGKNIHRLIHYKRTNGANYPEADCPICKTLIVKEGCVAEDDIFWKSDGNSIKVRYTSNPMVYNNGVIGVVVLFSDISDQKRKEDHITIRETVQEALINATTDLVWAIDKEYKLISYNRSYSKKILDLTGKPAKKGDSIIEDRFIDEYLKRWETYYQRAFNGETFMINEQVYNPVKRKMEYGLTSLAPMYDNHKELFGVACLSKDVTKETSTHVALIESYNELENIFNQSKDIICVIDKAGRFRKVSKAGEKIWGYRTQELVGRSYFDFVYHEDIDLTKRMSKVIMDGQDVTNFENRCVSKAGKLVPIIWSARWDKKIKLMFCVARDATDIKSAEKKLIQSEAFLEEAQRLAKMGNWSFDFKRDEITWSKELYHIFDIKAPTKTFCSFIDLVEDQNKESVQHTSRHAQETGEPFNIQYRITTAKGEKKIIEEFGYGEKDADGHVIRLFGTAQDITERKKSEEKIREIMWIQSHVVRVPVSRIIGLISLIKDKLIDESETEKTLDYILLAALELDNIIKDIAAKTKIIDH